jgi:hypothetical protein
MTCALVLVSSPLSAQTRKLEPFSVSGIALDTKGKPLKGVRVDLTTDFRPGRAIARTGADGRYAFSGLLSATYRVWAYLEMQYAGTKLCQRLAMPNPNDYNSFSVSQGAERNFRWRLTGQIGYSDTYFGGSLQIFNVNSDISSDTSKAVEFTLTPAGPLLDGSKAAVIVKQAPLDYPSSDDGLYDLPITAYKLKAVLIGKDGSRKALNVLGLGRGTEYKPEIDLVWQPEGGCLLGADNGFKPFFVQLELRR